MSDDKVLDRNDPDVRDMVRNDLAGKFFVDKLPETAHVTIETLRKEIHRMDPGLDCDSVEFRAAVVTMSGVIVGTSVPVITHYTGYKRSEVATYVRRLRTSRVFTRGGKVACDWFGKDGGIAFWLDVCVALGLMQRTA